MNYYGCIFNWTRALEMTIPIPTFVTTAAENECQQELIPEFYTEERLFVAEYVNDQAVPGFSLARCRVESGVTTELHSLAVNEWYAIESGQGLMDLNGEVHQVSAGSVVQIPIGTKQRITNTADQDLIFFCVCTPRFTTVCYRSHE